jgi:hypothetical protein
MTHDGRPVQVLERTDSENVIFRLLMKSFQW